MPFGNLSGPTLIVILFIVLLLFGAPKLPALAKSLGQSMKILKKELKSDGTENNAADGSAATPAAPAAAPEQPAPQAPAAQTPAAQPPANDTAAGESTTPETKAE